MSRRLTKSQQEKAIELLREVADDIEDYHGILVSEYNANPEDLEEKIRPFLKEVDNG